MGEQHVLGGYDSKKIKPERKHVGQIAYTDQCYTGTTVTVSKIFLNFPNGSSPNIMDTAEAGGSG
jgi:DNA mismatch repair ATPase MutL